MATGSITNPARQCQALRVLPMVAALTGQIRYAQPVRGDGDEAVRPPHRLRRGSGSKALMYEHLLKK